MASASPIPMTLVLVAVAIATVTDLWMLKIHNILTLPLCFSGTIYHLCMNGTEGLAGSVLGVVVGTVPLLVPYARGGMGAGDLKLIAGVGAWLGAWHVLHVLIVAGLATGVFAAGLIVWNRMRSLSQSSPELSASDISLVVRLAHARKRVVPFGAMLAVGVIGTLLWIGT